MVQSKTLFCCTRVVEDFLVYMFRIKQFLLYVMPNALSNYFFLGKGSITHVLRSHKNLIK